MDMWGISEEQMAKVCEDVPKEGGVCEWGTGGSTTRLLDECERKQAYLCSFENDPEWFSRMNELIQPNLRWTSRLYERKMMSNMDSMEIVRDYPRIKHGFGYSSGLIHSQQESGVLMADYVQACITKGDISTSAIPGSKLFFIDGYARGPCIACIHVLAQSGSVVYLHDALRQGWYDWATDLPRFDNHELVLGGSLLKFEVK